MKSTFDCKAAGRKLWDLDRRGITTLAVVFTVACGILTLIRSRLDALYSGNLFWKLFFVLIFTAVEAMLFTGFLRGLRMAIRGEHPSSTEILHYLVRPERWKYLLSSVVLMELDFSCLTLLLDLFAMPLSPLHLAGMLGIGYLRFRFFPLPYFFLEEEELDAPILLQKTWLSTAHHLGDCLVLNLRFWQWHLLGLWPVVLGLTDLAGLDAGFSALLRTVSIPLAGLLFAGYCYYTTHYYLAMTEYCRWIRDPEGVERSAIEDAAAREQAEARAKADEAAARAAEAARPDADLSALEALAAGDLRREWTLSDADRMEPEELLLSWELPQRIQTAPEMKELFRHCCEAAYRELLDQTMNNRRASGARAMEVGANRFQLVVTMTQKQLGQPVRLTAELYMNLL